MNENDATVEPTDFWYIDSKYHIHCEEYIEYHGKWYLFYHDCELSNGINHRRNVKFTELNFDASGKIITIFPYK